MVGSTSTTKIKPIETVYNGYRFRSRLEARWAVFFDALGIKYYYEYNGFDLGDAGRYLPDFWLPEFSTWIEIKGDPGERESAFVKAKALFDLTGCPVGVFEGLPGENLGAFFLYDATDTTAGGSSEPFYGGFVANTWRAYEDPYEDREIPPEIILLSYRSDRVFLSSRWESLPRYSGDPTCDGPDLLNLCRHLTHHEINAAKAARFEHGERGAAV